MTLAEQTVQSALPLATMPISLKLLMGMYLFILSIPMKPLCWSPSSQPKPTEVEEVTSILFILSKASIVGRLQCSRL